MRYDSKLLLDRALPLEQAGDWESAIALCEEGFRQSIAERELDTLVEALFRLGLCYRQTDAELATEYFELTLVVAELHGDHSHAGRALNALATQLYMHGQLDLAESHYHRARELAFAGDNLLTSGQIDQNLGSLAVVRGDRKQAKLRYSSALHCYREIGHDRGVAGVLNNLGMMHVDIGEYGVAKRYLDEALLVSRRTGDLATEGIIHINRTEMLIGMRDLEGARASCDEAYELVSRMGEHSNRADALSLYGIIYRETKKYHLAEVHFREAIEVASRFTYPLQEAEAQREMALVLRTQDRNREALQALNRAHELFRRLQAKRWEADINQRIGKLETEFLSLVRGWGESIEAKDRYTSGHCERVADYACLIAAESGVPEPDMIWFRMGAFLHDVGKTEVPEEILNKPGKLTASERKIIEHHTVAGDEILSSIEFPWDIRPMVRSHHERWDGTGYPDRLAGEEIPLTARILRIADVYDALTTTRSYRSTLSPERAFEMMEEDAGSFDPDIFAIFKELFPRIRASQAAMSDI
jgi:putative nucleotidyltransferase with HDIG domain